MFLYRFLSSLALLAYAPFALLRALTGGRRLGDIRGRLGRRPYPDLAGGIWAHAVSVGEVGVARNLLDALARRAPDRPLGISVTTVAGRELADRTFEDKASVFAFPFDLAGPVETALSSVRPGLILLTETEIWPLFLQRAHLSGIPVALINGRVSARSFTRYRLARGFLAKSLGHISLFAMQTSQDADRIRALGAPERKIHVTGNIKYDLPTAPPFADAQRLTQAAAGLPIFVAASTGAGEEKQVLEAWRPVASRCLLALAPRRPERFDEVARLIESSGFSLLRRSVPSSVSSNHKSQITNHKSPIYLLDSIGELASLYRETAVAFVGGSLVPTGGHNPIEAWAQGVPVVTGPHMENFREIADLGERGGYLSRARDHRELARILTSWLANPGAARDQGERARQFVAGNRGAADVTANLVLELLAADGVCADGG